MLDSNNFCLFSMKYYIGAYRYDRFVCFLFFLFNILSILMSYLMPKPFVEA